MESVLYRNFVKYLYSVVSNFSDEVLAEYIDFYINTGFYFSKQNASYSDSYSLLLSDLNKILAKTNSDINFSKINYDANSRIFFNHVLRGLNTFYEIKDGSLYFNDYQKFSNNSFVHDFLSLFYHVSFRGKTISFTIPILKRIHSFCKDNGLTFLASDINLKISEMYFASHEFKNFKLRSDSIESEISTYSNYIKIKNFIELITIKYNSVVYVDSSKLDEIFEVINTHKILVEYDLYTQNYLLLLNIEYTYYRDFKSLGSLLEAYNFFLRLNKNVLDKNTFDNGCLNYNMHRFLIEPRITFLETCIDLYGKSLRVTSIKINIIIHILLMSLVLSEVKTYEKYISELNQYESTSVYKSLFSIVCYFQASHHHLTGQYKQCQLALNEAAPLLNDKSGYGLGIRILEIMNFIKWEKFDQVENALLNLKNHITQLKKGGKLKPRYLYIYKILVRLHSSGYDYKDTFRLHKEKLHQMNGDLIEYAWEFRSPELLRFDLWFFDQAGFLPNWSLNDPRINK